MNNLSSLKMVRLTALIATGAAITFLALLVIAAPTWTIMALCCLTLVANTAALFFNSKSQKTISTIQEVAERISQGDLEARIIPIDNHGELAVLQRQINQMIDVTDAFVRESEASTKFISQGKFFRRIILRGTPGSFRRSSMAINKAIDQMDTRDKHIKKMSEEFDQNIRGVTDLIASASTEMEATARDMSTGAATMSEQASDMEGASHDASKSVSRVVTGAGELSALIDEITSSANHSSGVAENAVESVESANAAVAGLESVAAEIGEVVSLITDIADQTNLLALNATIEAARAGDAGKGFAVVASEVKSLANQTAQATDGISKQVSQMQMATNDAVASISSITDIINAVQASVLSISEAVDKQRTSISGIETNVSSATSSTSAVTQRASSVSAVASETGTSSAKVFSAAGDLAREAETLRSGVDTFFGALKNT